MTTQHSLQRHGRRRGVILIVVVACLALFLSVGIAFVFYANQQAISMRFQREASNGGRAADVNQYSRGSTDEAPPQAVDIFNQTLGQVIYDVGDDQTEVCNGLRGASLARAMYGLFYSGSPSNPTYGNNNVPYNGIGRIHENSTFPPVRLTGKSPFDTTNTNHLTDFDFAMVNYTYFSGDHFVRDPERLHYRSSPTALGFGGSKAQLNPYMPVNAAYTYPDEKDIYLASINPKTGHVTVPSFFRPWVFGTLASGTNGSANANWTNQIGKYLIHRPRPQEHFYDSGDGRGLVTDFPYPQTANANAANPVYGDVENLEGKQTQQFDSLWIDPDLPVRKWRGRSYKPLVALLIVDLDGRVNLNVAGNKTETGNTNGSLQGWGPWEMDLKYILTSTTESENRLFQSGYGRYGTTTYPQRVLNLDNTTGANSNSAPSGTGAPYYSTVDFDGSTVTAGATPARMTLPPAQSLEISPTYPPRYADGSTNERLNHPLLYNPYLLKPDTSGGTSASNQVFSPYEMRLLNFKFNGDDSTYKTAELAQTQLYPTTLGKSTTAGTLNPRFVLTTMSNDIDRPGLAPWIRNLATGGTSNRQVATGHFSLNQAAPPAGQPYQPVTLSVNQVAFPAMSTRNSAAMANALDDFDDTNKTWKALHAAVGSIDLNRKLSDYRAHPNPTTNPPPATGSWYGNITGTSYARALNDRQRFAKDIFDRLCYAVGANNNPSQVNPTTDPDEFNGLRWLAQLAVNIVDFIDNDDYITPFVWNPPVGSNGAVTPFSWNTTNGAPSDPTIFQAANASTLGNHVVFGTEQPRLVINEVAMTVENGTVAAGVDHDATMAPPGANGQPANQPHATFYIGKVWVELLNPLTTLGASTLGMSNNGGAALRVNNQDAYRLLLTAQNMKLRQLSNVNGRPDATVHATVSLSGDTDHPNEIIPASTDADTSQAQRNQQYAPARGQNSPFCVVGPGPVTGAQPAQNPSIVKNNLAGLNGGGTGMQFKIDPNTYSPLGQAPPNNGKPAFTDVLLERVTCPDILGAAGIDQTLATVFVTIDYLQIANTTPPAPAQPTTMINDLRTRTQSVNGGPGNPLVPVPANQQHSFGRKQPFAGDPSQVVQQAPTAPTGFKDTFFRHNGVGTTIATAGATLTQPFDWLVHLDRSLVSPVELFNVSAWKPHELTQQFVNSAGAKFQHLANWESNSTRLYRTLSLLETRSRVLGMGFEGRVPGKININTIQDISVLQAMADPNSGNYFTAAEINTLYNNILTSRDGGTTGPTSTNSPFQSFGVPDCAAAANSQFPNGSGYDKTILRPSPTPVAGTTPANLFNVPGQTHPYLQNELLNKIFNNMTTRSNTFAVWCTIGYFEVRNPGPYSTTNRPMLGKELGSDDGTNIRHKFFAIVDRTNLTVAQATNSSTGTSTTLQGDRPVFLSYEPVPVPVTPQPPTAPYDLTNPDPDTTQVTSVKIRVPATSLTTVNGRTTLKGLYDGQSWTIAQGDSVLLDVGPQQESVTVSAVTYDNINTGTVTLTLPNRPANPPAVAPAHYRGCIIQLDAANSALGNPGPQPSFNFKDPRYSSVVPLVKQIN